MTAKQSTIFLKPQLLLQEKKKYGKHPTQKPVQLLDTFVKILTNENDTVFDPFCGSGSSGVAALQNGRNFIGSEINEEYCRITKERIAQVLNYGNA